MEILLWLFAVVLLVGVFWYWSEAYMARKHMREALRETNAWMESMGYRRRDR